MHDRFVFVHYNVLPNRTGPLTGFLCGRWKEVGKTSPTTGTARLSLVRVSQKVAASSDRFLKSGPITDAARSARFTAYPGWARDGCTAFVPLRVSGRFWGIYPFQIAVMFPGNDELVNTIDAAYCNQCQKIMILQ